MIIQGIEFVGTPHPNRPELASYYSESTNLWLVLHDDDSVNAGLWTCYSAADGWISGTSPELAFERFVGMLRDTPHMPYSSPELERSAAAMLELIASVQK